MIILLRWESTPAIVYTRIERFLSNGFLVWCLFWKKVLMNVHKLLTISTLEDLFHKGKVSAILHCMFQQTSSLKSQTFTGKKEYLCTGTYKPSLGTKESPWKINKGWLSKQLPGVHMLRREIPNASRTTFFQESSWPTKGIFLFRMNS